MIVIDVEQDFDAWRDRARGLLAARVEPERILWRDATAGGSLFQDADPLPEAIHPQPVRLPKKLVDRARTVSCHRDEDRWPLLYSLLWRVGVEGDRELLADSADTDVRRFESLERQVRFDAHKAKAFIRFRRVQDTQDEHEHYVAWHKPAHRVLPIVTPFFVRRFNAMRWTIFTPDASADWDGSTLRLGPGVDRDPLDERDELEHLWKTYYRSIFNPARIKLGAMTREMPRRYWATMPETSIIDELLREAPERVRTMIDMNRQHGAEDFLPPPNHRSLPQLVSAARECEGCDLHGPATQVVFGEGNANAALMFVGEQPGNEEDLAGRPFVGPAGQVLNEALEAAHIDRTDTYVTNAVKHFRFEERGKRRIHKKPTISQQRACLPWLRAEIQQVQPRIIVTLGATASQALLGRTFRLTRQGGVIISDNDWHTPILATGHPSAILRAPDAAKREALRTQLITDLTTVRDFLRAA